MTNSAQFGLTDYVVVLGYFAVMLAVGLFYSSRMRDLKSFFNGGQAIPWWLAGISFYMSSHSAFMLVAYSALAYQYGFVAVTLYWVTVPAAIVSAMFLAGRWRRAATISPLEFIEQRFGLAMRQMLAWMTLPMRLIDDSLKLVALGTLIAGSVGMPLTQGVVLSGICVLAYTLLGGIWAVLVTDFVQFIVMLAVIMTILPLAFGRVGGFASFLEAAPDSFFALTNQTYTWPYLAAFLVIQVLFMGSTWSLVQRFYSVERDADAKKVGYLVAVLNVLTPPLIFAPAMAARLFLPEGTSPDQVYVRLCMALVPVGMAGLLVTSMFSATMAMLSGGYHSYAAVLTHDVYIRFFGEHQSQRTLVVVGRVATLLVGSIALILAFVVINSRGDTDLFAIMVELFSICLPPIALPMLAGLTIRRVSNGGAVGGLLVGTAVGVTAFAFGGAGAYPWLRQTPIMVPLTVISTLAGMAIGTWLRPGTAAQRQEIETFFAKLERPDPERARPIGAADPSRSALSVMGVSVLALGLLLVSTVLLTLPLREAAISLVVGSGMVLVGGLLVLIPGWLTRRELANGRIAGAADSRL